MVCTVIIGGGPASLALAYILQGHKPVYDPVTYGPHPDSYFHAKLLEHADLLSASTDEALLSYIASSPNFVSFYSASVLPVNLLIDALRFSDELAAASPASQVNSRIIWVDTPPITDCVIVGTVGGQWASQSVDRPDTLAISYVEMLSLPGYSLSEYMQSNKAFVRPSRSVVAQYYQEYVRRFKLPVIDGFVGSITPAARPKTARFSVHIQGRTAPLTCQNIVLASGVNGLAARAYDEPATAAPVDTTKIAVIGSGLSAADAILEAWKSNKDVIHEFNHPEALKKYPQSLYPEYHSVYLAMTQGAPRYERGRAGAHVAKKFRLGRRGSLKYAQSVLPFAATEVTRTSLRGLDLELTAGLKAECCLAPHIWACGSLCGDTTVRYIIGTCCAVAAGVRQHAQDRPDPGPARATQACHSHSPALTSNPRTVECCARDASPSRAG